MDLYSHNHKFKFFFDKELKFSLSKGIDEMFNE